MAFSYKFLLRAKQPTQLPTHFKLLGESKVRILRPWQTAQPRLSIQDDPLEQIRARLANQSISMSEVLGAACRAPKRQRVGSRRSSAAAKGKSGSGFSTLNDRSEWRARAPEKGKDARPCFDAKTRGAAEAGRLH